MCLSKTARNGDVLGVAFDEVSEEGISSEVGEETKLTLSSSSFPLQGDFKSHSEDPVPWDQKKEHLYWVSVFLLCFRCPDLTFPPSPFRSEDTRLECASLLSLASSQTSPSSAHSIFLPSSIREKSLNHGISWRLSHRPRLHQALT